MSHVHRFFLSPAVPLENAITLSGAEAHHAIHVVRVKPGERVALFDGQGTELVGEVARVGKRDIEVAVVESRREPRPDISLTLVQAGLHRDKAMESLVRQCTALGVERLRFFRAQRSERQVRPNAKWRRAAIEACKQCGRPWLPVIETAENLGSALDDIDGALLMATADAPPIPLSSALTANSVALLVGPEGDFTQDELAVARARGASPISLGATTFRAEVAALVGVALIQYELGRLGPHED